MKIRFFILVISIFISSYSYSQKAEKLIKPFWEAIDSKSDKEIIKYGELIIQYLETEKPVFDSTQIYIRIYTGISYSNLRYYEKAIKSLQSTRELIETHWG